MEKFNVKVGDKIQYRIASGELRSIEVTSIEIENSQGVFLGETLPEYHDGKVELVWGWADQIVKVLKED
ncbi:hypothetical protein EBR57_10210 [bacterium]|nr:hypothetical protein [bacterium]